MDEVPWLRREEPPQGEALKEVRVCRHKGVSSCEPAGVRTRGDNVLWGRVQGRDRDGVWGALHTHTACIASQDAWRCPVGSGETLRISEVMW